MDRYFTQRLVFVKTVMMSKVIGHALLETVRPQAGVPVAADIYPTLGGDGGGFRSKPVFPEIIVIAGTEQRGAQAENMVGEKPDIFFKRRVPSLVQHRHLIIHVPQEISVGIADLEYVIHRAPQLEKAPIQRSGNVFHRKRTARRFHRKQY